MACPYATGVASSASATSLDVSFSAAPANSLILVFAAVRSTSATLAVSGYTGLSSQQTNDAWRSRPFVKLATGGETSLTITTGVAAAAMNATVYVIKGNYSAGTAADACPDVNYTAGSTGYTMASGSITTTYANSLIVECANWDASWVIVEPADCNIRTATQYQATGAQMISGTRFKAATGALSTFSYTANNNANAGIAWTVAIRDDGDNNRPTILNDGRAYLHKLGGYSALTAGAPDSVTGLTAINGVNMNTVANTSAGSLTLATAQVTASPWQVFASSWACTQTLTSDAWVGNFFTPGSTFALNGKTILLPYAFGTTIDSGRVGANGSIFVVVDSADNWAAYQVLAQAQWTVSGYGTVTFRPGTTAVLDESTTPPDLDDLVTFGYFHHRKSGTSTSVTVYFAPPIYEASVSSFVGGNESIPVSAKQISKLLLGANIYPEHCLFQGNGQLISKMGLQIGDGTTATNAKLTAQSIETPSSENTLWRAGASSAPVYFYGSASDTLDLRAATFSTEYAQPFAFNASHDTGATVYTTGLSVVGPWSITWQGGETAAGISMTGSAAIETDGANFTDCTITETTSAAALSVSVSGSTLDGDTIDGTGADYALELGTSVTAVTLTDCTITAGSTDKVSVLKTTGTVTITISGTTSLVAGDVTTAGATVVISAPVEYQSVTLSNYVTGSRVQIYDTTNAVELYNDIPAAAPQTLWTDSVAASTSGARDIRVRVAYVSGVTAKQFIEAAIGSVASSGSGIALSYRVNQSADTVYDANGLNGSTIYGAGEITFTDSSPDVINMDMAADTISLPTQYAAWVYYAFTSTGIATDIDYINAIDTANYEYSGIKWKNTSSPTSPLKVTGGYAWDSATLDPMDLIDDTGGTLFLAPAHVVPYATGSGVTPSDVTDIAAASATASAAAIVSAAVDGTTTLAESLRLANAVLGGKVSGAGSTAETFRNLADTKDRMVFTVDSSGNRTAVTRNLT